MRPRYSREVDGAAETPLPPETGEDDDRHPQQRIDDTR